MLLHALPSQKRNVCTRFLAIVVHLFEGPARLVRFANISFRLYELCELGRLRRIFFIVGSEECKYYLRERGGRVFQSAVERGSIEADMDESDIAILNVAELIQKWTVRGGVDEVLMTFEGIPLPPIRVSNLRDPL